MLTLSPLIDGGLSPDPCSAFCVADLTFGQPVRLFQFVPARPYSDHNPPCPTLVTLLLALLLISGLASSQQRERGFGQEG